MSKIICEVCGTVYQDSSEFCPICGYAHSEFTVQPQDDFLLDSPLDDLDSAADPDSNDLDYEEEVYSDAPQPIADFDDDFDDDYEEEPQHRRSVPASTFVIILLVVIITLLLLAIGVLFFGFYLPNQAAETPATEATLPQFVAEAFTEEETTEPSIPCTSLVLTSGVTELTKQGQYWLLHVTVLPEDTTDTLIFVSEDESVVTVNEHGRLTAVDEGETVVHISCGDKTIKCKVVVRFEEEDEVTSETESHLTPNSVEHETLPESVANSTEPAKAEETVPPEEETVPVQETTATGDIVLKLEQFDVSSTTKGVSFELKLDCDLKPEDVTWLTMDSKIAIVKNGVVTTIGPGQTRIIAQYNGQQAECIVRCNF